MAGAIIGALRVVLGVDTAALETGFKGAESNLAGFAASAAKVGVAVAAAAVAVGVGVGVAVKHAIDEADNLGKMAQKVGIPVEELSRLKLAADLSDVSMESLSTSMGKLSKNMVAVASGADNEVSRAFRAIGVSVQDATGKIRPSSEVLADIAGKFKGYEDGASKTALAIQLFGKAGAGMIPLLNAGADGLREAAEEAEKFGIVIDTKTAKSAEAFNDNLTRLGKVKDGIIIRITAGMLPALENLTNAFVATAKGGTFVETVSKGVGVALQALATGAVAVATAFQGMWQIISTIFTAMKQASTLQFGAALETLKGGVSGLAENIKGSVTTINTIWTDGLTQAATTSATQGPLISAPIVQAADTSKNAVEGYLASLAKQQAAQNAEILAADLYVGAKEKMRVADQAAAIAKANNIPLTEQLKQKIDAAANAAASYAQKLQGVHLIQQNRTPAENYRIDLENARLSMEALGASTEQVGRVQEAIAQRYGATWEQASESIAGSIQKIGTSFGKENKAMALVAKAAGIVQGTISMFTGAAKALELPFPANLAAMASVLATGAGLVASIRSTSVGGFATGGSFKVPGGTGGGDRMRAMVDLEPGEQVDIWRPGEAGADPRRGTAGGREITINMQGETFGQKAVRRMIEAINEALDDGAVLKVRPV